MRTVCMSRATGRDTINMNLLSTIRRRQRRATRLTPGLFIVFWFGIALPPCIIAQDRDGISDYHCPHCPPTESHHTHPGDAVSEAQASVDMPCSPDAAQCAAIDDYNYDGRSADIRIKDLPGDSPIAVLPVVMDSAWPTFGESAPSRSDVRTCPCPAASLNVLYCVYLK